MKWRLTICLIFSLWFYSASGYNLSVLADSSTSIYLSKKEYVNFVADSIMDRDIVFQAKGDIVFNSRVLRGNRYIRLIAFKKGYEVYSMEIPKRVKGKQLEVNLKEEMKRLPFRTDSASYISLNKIELEINYGGEPTVEDELGFFYKVRKWPKDIFEANFRNSIRGVHNFYLERCEYMSGRELFNPYVKTLNLDLDVSIRFPDDNSDKTLMYCYIDYSLKDVSGKEFKSGSARFEQKLKNKTRLEHEELYECVNKYLFKLLDSPTVRNSANNLEVQFESIHQEWKPIQMKGNKQVALFDIDDLKSAIVTVSVKDGHGSGVIVSSDGYVITNHHVAVNSDSSVTLHLFDGVEKQAEVVRMEPRYDLALLKINETEFSGYFVIPDSISLNVKDKVFAMGTPLDERLGHSVANGFVACNRQFEDFEIIQFQAAVNSGNSGGALIQAASNSLVGIVTQKLTGIGVNRVGFALPASLVKDALKISYQ